ncbi:hypothetical protein [Pedobacter sp. Leaf250]|uniref:hypothetical protein n=1 Tax=Pedobacter sp. Leaf250 TaxID=2876559 RepID=UPI001E49D023|nr:hypothetical protein [Pedobacter sp. Leaf250]
MDIDFNKIKTLYDIEDNSFGLEEFEILDCENRLDIKLPKVLRKYYVQLGNHNGLNQTQDRLLLPNQLYLHDNGYLVFYEENQAVSIWGIRQQDLTLENPLVYIAFDKDEWILENTLSDFLTPAGYLQSLFAFPFGANAVAINNQEETFVRTNWTNTGIGLKIWDAEFFQNDLNEVLGLIKSDNQVDLFVATETENRLKEIDKKLNFNWEYFSLDD